MAVKALYSSSPVAAGQSRQQQKFKNVFALDPSSSDSLEEIQLGLDVKETAELSPTLDASFNSSMSIGDSNAMDISPAADHKKQEPSFTKTFFSQMSSNQPKQVISTRNTSDPTTKTHARLFGSEVQSNVMMNKKRSKSEATLNFAKPTQPLVPRPNMKDIRAREQSTTVTNLKFARPGPKIRQAIPQEWKAPLLVPAWTSKDNLNKPSLESQSSFNTLAVHAEMEEISSPPLDPMDIDPRSPYFPSQPSQPQITTEPASLLEPDTETKSPHVSGNSSMDEFFKDSPHSLPPEPVRQSSANNKKRSYEADSSLEESALPSSPLMQAQLYARPPLIKAASIAAPNFLSGSQKRRASDRSLSSRPPLGFLRAHSTLGNSRPPSLEVSPPAEKQDYQQALKKSRTDIEGQSRPSLIKNRRAQSVCDAKSADNSTETSLGHSKSGSISIGLGKPPMMRPATFSFKPKHVNSVSDSFSTSNKRIVSEGQKPISNGLTEQWGTNEADGKALPCHSVKEDGLMRVMPNVVADLVEGKYASLIDRFLIIDCRFPWEFEGGHIQGAINLHLAEQVEGFFLSPGNGLRASCSDLPFPSKSGEAHPEGKTVIIFHCEYSEMRAPVAARNLRNKDRSKCRDHYPRIHYPELYILAGGYASFWESFPHICDPQGYVQMKQSQLCPKQYEDFRRRNALGRAKSFTFGDGFLNDPLSGARLTMDNGPQDSCIREEEHENSVDQSRLSANSSSPSALEVSPCGGASKALDMRQRLLKGQSLPTRINFQRAATETQLDFRDGRKISNRIEASPF